MKAIFYQQVRNQISGGKILEKMLEMEIDEKSPFMTSPLVTLFVSPPAKGHLTLRVICRSILPTNELMVIGEPVS